ncbi:hypothetical protein [Synechococcus sp. PCC 6312]|nr:hypothetical protein [Synechococcus sp. PCC 6312]
MPNSWPYLNLVYHSAQEPEYLLKSADVLSGEAVISGLTIPIADFFQGL